MSRSYFQFDKLEYVTLIPNFLYREINGVTICYKMGNVQDTQSGDHTAQNGNATPSRPAPVVSPGSSVYPSLTDSDHDYEILRHGNTPSRPAPQPPVITHQNSTHTLSSNFHGLDGVPFVVNPKFLHSSSEKVSVFFYSQLEKLYSKIFYRHNFQ